MNSGMLSSWQMWAVLSALFAALTAIFAKVGVENINSDLATLIRTIIVLCVLSLIVYGTGQFQNPAQISGRTYLFLLLSGLGTGASWLCYFRALKIGNAAQVAPIDKMSVVLVAIFGVAFLGEKLSPVNWLGVALVAAGALLVAFGTTCSHRPMRRLGTFLAGELTTPAASAVAIADITATDLPLTADMLLNVRSHLKSRRRVFVEIL
jgi:bacterial/archaeal transporter family protein